MPKTRLYRHHQFRHKLLMHHHRIGVVAALFVLLLAGTGLLLNHSDALGLPNKAVQSNWLKHWYGMEAPQIKSYPVGDAWISHLGGNQLYLDAAEVAPCGQPLRGALMLNDLIIALCNQELVLLTDEGEMIEKIGRVHGLPANPVAVGKLEGKLVLRSEQGEFITDLEDLHWQALHGVPVASPSQIIWAQQEEPPQQLQQKLTQQFSGTELTMERVLLDLHSGRLWGHWGPYWMDLMAILFAMLAVSGVWVWMTRPGHIAARK